MDLLDEMLEDDLRFTQEVLGVSVPQVPGKLSSDRFQFRFDHLTEELTELNDAKSWEDQADALVDLIYVAMGSLIEMGIVPGSVWNEVHRANMEKVAGEKSTRPDGKGYDAIKPEGWEPPDHRRAAMSLSMLNSLSPILMEVTRLRKVRGAAYNEGSVKIEDYFPLGDASYYQMCHLKLLRCKSIMEGGSGTVEDSLLDLINYATFWAENKAGVE